MLMTTREPIFNIREKAPLYLCGLLIAFHIFVALPFTPGQWLSHMNTLYFDNGQYSAVFTVLTHGFFHADFSHVIMNSFMILIFGTAACEASGRDWRKAVRFLVLFLGSIIIGGLSQWAWWTVSGGSGGAIGASGGASGLFAAMAWATGGRSRLIQFGLIWAIIQAVVVFSEAVGIAPFSTAVAAHMGGYVGGAILSVIMLKPSSVKFKLGL